MTTMQQNRKGQKKCVLALFHHQHIANRVHLPTPRHNCKRMVASNNPTRSMLTATFYALMESLVQQPDPSIREIEDVLDSLDNPEGDPSLTGSLHLPLTRIIALLQQQQPEPDQTQASCLSNLRHSQKNRPVNKHTSPKQIDFGTQEEQQTTTQQPCLHSNQPIDKSPTPTSVQCQQHSAPLCRDC